MTKFVALMRGINVGGHRKIKMADLKQVIMAAGFDGVQTYVQSGNVVFEGAAAPVADIGQVLEAACEKAFGFHTEIMVRDAATFRAEAEACPYVDAALEPLGGRETKLLHVAFLSAAPNAAHIEAVTGAYNGPEDIALRGNALYIYYREGSGRSDFTKLLTAKKLGVSPTSRNWNTVLKLLAMLEGA
ncbi:DUF1697 domain-containing protein [Kordiimonas sp.]|uniref:DUF1697 domain-containing protein n=1 Tax=Kordiimonas sp. TaxID=1970157 RepID=UPI003A8E796E